MEWGMEVESTRPVFSLGYGSFTADPLQFIGVHILMLCVISWTRNWIEGTRTNPCLISLKPIPFSYS